jgi:hypothetical protein
MDIKTFSELSVGKWVSQRTSHELTTQTSDSGRSDLFIEVLNADDPSVGQVCQQHGIPPTQATCGLRTNWEGLMARDTKKQQGATVLVFVADPTDPSQGQVLHAPNGKQAASPTAGRFSIGPDEAVTLITETDKLYAEERLWFAGPNLRLRTGLLKQGEVSVATFFSEIRMGGTPAPAANAPE